MRRFDVFRNPSGSKDSPFVLLVQHELLDALSTRVVAPLVRRSVVGPSLISRLNPCWTIEKTEVVMLTQQLGAVRVGSLSARVCSLAAKSTEIIGALDVLFSGV